MLVVAFPTEYEAVDFLKGLEKREKKRVDGVVCHAGYVGKTPVLVPIIGIGPAKAHASTQTIIDHVEIKVFILAGFAGALTSEVFRGQILIARGYSSESLINYIKLIPGFDIGGLHPVNEVVATAEEKQRLGQETGCQMVDMETAYVAHLVASNGIEFLGIRAISDLVDEDIPRDVLECGYDQAESRTTPVKLMGFLALHPKRIAPLKKFLEPLPEVRRKLTDFLLVVAKEF